MSVQVHLDQHDVPFYTNLDFISGKVLLSLTNDITISAINVKLEGESRTRLLGPRNPLDRPDKVRVELELHKLLYKVHTVFPGPEILEQTAVNPQFTLPAGQHEYPFSFKFPFNNDCKNTPNSFQDLKLGQLNVPFMQEPVTHLRRPLPPTLGGFPGEAEIKYFVKVTVVRPKFYHENMRIVQILKFLPIEPPRPENQHQEQYARREHQFQSSKRESKIGLFKRTSYSAGDEPPSLKIDARLPSPAILTCHQPVPLRVLIEKTNASQANIYLSMLQVELNAFTDSKAHHLKRSDVSSWILVSKANMDMVLDSPTDKNSKQFQIPSRLWDSIPLPDTVIPSFETCNLARRYELEVRIGLSHSMADNSKPEMIVLPLRIPCQVFSGIPPPPELLHRLKPQGPLLASPTSANPQSVGKPSGRNPALFHSPVTPTSNNASLPPIGTPVTGHHISSDLNDLPPSYEDAMAEDIGPVDGPRQHFETSEAAQRQQPAYSGDSKSPTGLMRHPSERLFSQNAPRPPQSAGPRAGLPTDQANTVFEEPSDDEFISAQQRTGTSDATIIHATDGLRLSAAEDASEPPPPPLPLRKPLQQAGATEKTNNTQKESQDVL